MVVLRAVELPDKVETPADPVEVEGAEVVVCEPGWEPGGEVGGALGTDGVEGGGGGGGGGG